MTRDEHIKWCKDRAYTEINFYQEGKHGVISMMSDLAKHPETASHPGIKLGAMFLLMGEFTSIEKAKKFIDGFN